MKVILLKDVAKLGRKYETKEVARGYGRNFLIPQGFAELAEKHSAKNLENIKRAEEQRRNAELKELEGRTGEISGKIVELHESANEDGHLYAGIHKKEILSALQEQHGIILPEEFLQLEKPVKELGEFDLNVEVGATHAVFKLVIAQKEGEEK